MKPGYKTTELYVILALIVGDAATAAGDHLSPSNAAICATVAGVAYAVSRGLAKLGAGVPSSDGA